MTLMIHMDEEQLGVALFAALRDEAGGSLSPAEARIAERLAESVLRMAGRTDVIVLDSESGETAAHYRNGTRGHTYDYDDVSDHVLRSIGVEIRNADLYQGGTSHEDIPTNIYDLTFEEE